MKMKRISIFLVSLLSLAGLARAQEAPVEEVAGRSKVLRRAFRDVAEKVRPSVVKVQAGERRGHGVIIDDWKDRRTWVVLTHAGLVQDVQGEVVLINHQGRKVQARVLGVDGMMDVALLGYPMDGNGGFGGASIPKQDDVHQGQWVFTCGLEDLPLACGAVSAVNRNVDRERKNGGMGLMGIFGQEQVSPVRVYEGLLQHDSPLEKEHLGTPLVDDDGLLVGLNVASFHRGTSFAMPWSRIEPRIKELAFGLRVAPPAPNPGAAEDGENPFGDMEKMLRDMFKGMDGQDGENPFAKLFGKDSPFGKMFGGDREGEQAELVQGNGFLGVRLAESAAGQPLGAIVEEPLAGHPGAAAGLKKGDIIIKVDDEAIGDRDDLIQAISGREPGAEVALTVLRLDPELGTQEKLTLKATLGDRRKLQAD